LWIGGAVTTLAGLGVGCLLYPLAAKALQTEAVKVIHSIEANYDTWSLLRDKHKALELARQIHEKAALLQSNDEVLQNNLGLVCKEQKDYGCAIAHYQKALELARDPESLSTIYFNLGVLSEDRQEYENAIAHYQKARRHQPNDARAANNLARLLIWQRQQPQSALQLIQDTLQESPHPELQAALLKNLGWAYLQLGDYTKAQAALRESLEQQENASAVCLLAKAKQQMNPESAVPAWNACLSAKSSLPEVRTWQLDAGQYRFTSPNS
jgi:tetratricopeptide (TPR) repeat protein